MEQMPQFHFFSLIKRALGSFQFEAVANRAVINILAYVSWRAHTCVSVSYAPRSIECAYIQL